MLYYKLNFLLAGLISFSAYSQIATNSLFRETKSINPAVISKRPDAVFSIVGKADQVEKGQDLSTSAFGSEAKSDSKVKVTSQDLFYGGKGNGFTSELFLNNSIGKKDDKITTPFFSNSQSNSVTSQYGHLGLGLGQNFGISMGGIKYSSKGSFEFSNNGTTYSDNYKSDTTAIIPKLGIAYKMLLDWGIFYQRMMMKSTTVQNGTEQLNKDKFDIAGGGVGTSSKNFHTEVAFERYVKTNRVTNDGITYREVFPSRAMFSLEFFWGKLSLGYTGFYYQNGFMNFDNLLFNSLVYAENWEKARLENNFNFSLGSEKGHSFSGSVSFSNLKSSEKNMYAGGETKFPTTTKSMGISVKYAYIF